MLMGGGLGAFASVGLCPRTGPRLAVRNPLSAPLACLGWFAFLPNGTGLAGVERLLNGLEIGSSTLYCLWVLLQEVLFRD